MGNLNERPDFLNQRFKYSVDQLLEKRLSGWEAKEWIFLSMLGEMSFLDDCVTVERAEHYHGLHGCSVIVVASRSTANDGYKEIDKLIEAGVLNIGFWMLELSKIAEVVFHGYRHPKLASVYLGDEWAAQVRLIAEGLAA